MLNKGNDQEIEKNFMTMRIQDNKENKNTQKEILMNLKETMINLTKINYNIGAAKFVVGNDVRVYLEQKPVNSAGIALAWNALNNTIGGRQAIGTDTLSAKRALYANFAKATAMGIWGQPEVVIDGTSKAGRIKVTTLGFYKPVVTNK